MNDQKIVQENLNILKDDILYCNINIDEVLDSIHDMVNKKILNQHNYAITQNKDGRFSTYIFDEAKKNHRRKIVKPTRELLEKEIIKIYKEMEKKKALESICLRKFYANWMEYKSYHTNSSAYLKTIDELWKKFYVNTDIIDIPIKELDKYTLDIWAHSLIKDNNMTKKKYYNTTIIMRQSLDYAVERNIISKNPFENIKIDSKLFRKPKKKADSTQVFLTDEQDLIEKEAYRDFYETNNVTCLAIPFAFQTGMRISEIVALKWSDINDEVENTIHVQRMEIISYKKLPSGEWGKPYKEVVERTKSDAGNRNIYLTSNSLKILELIRKVTDSMNYYDSDYIFLNENGRIKARSLDTKIRKYCKHINISEKSMHKIRKTYISTLIDNQNININYIRQQVGHTDERTTYGNYCFNRKPKDLTQQEMEKSLVSSK